MASTLPEAAIRKFWSWFGSVADELAKDFENEALLEALDLHVASLGEVSWELGPGGHAENALTISPDGDPDLLSVTQRIVALAPPTPQWEFHYARQPRPENLEYSIERTDGTEVDIDARRWRYVLYRFPDGVCDLILEQKNMVLFNDDERYMAAVVLVDSVLGEATRLARINQIEPVSALSKEQAAKANSVKVLAGQFQSFLNA